MCINDSTSVSRSGRPRLLVQNFRVHSQILSSSITFQGWKWHHSPHHPVHFFGRLTSYTLRKMLSLSRGCGCSTYCSRVHSRYFTTWNGVLQEMFVWNLLWIGVILKLIQTDTTVHRVTNSQTTISYGSVMWSVWMRTKAYIRNKLKQIRLNVNLILCDIVQRQLKSTV